MPKRDMSVLRNQFEISGRSVRIPKPVEEDG